MTYSIWPAAKVDQPEEQEIYEIANRLEAEGFDPEEWFYNAAVVRVADDEELTKYREVLIETDWNDPDHLQWVATAPKEDIVSWADVVSVARPGVERTLNLADAFEYLDTYLDAACGGDIAGAVGSCSSAGELLDMLNGCLAEPMPVTLGQFGHYLRQRGHIE